VRIDELLRQQSQINDGPGAALPESAPDVAFEQVVFAYRDERRPTAQPETAQDAAHTVEETVLQGVSFRLAPGEILGLLGRTGSGKTTITRLLLRHVDVSAGAIRLHGIDLRTMRLADLRRHVGMVTQDVQLFNASVRDNLTFFDPDISDERILAALAELGLDEWVRSLPQGLATNLQPGGSGLSAGEAQLLAFARIFLHNPQLVILDEASSRLDPATERLMERAVKRLLQGRTAIIIAHRLDTVQRADTILILEQGRVAEYGSRAQLAADPESRFAGLLRVGMEEALA
jgi:ATP-binding cassette subfamily B protein